MSAITTDDYGAHPRDEAELVAYLRSLTTAQHDYDSSAEALRDGTVACFNYLASALGNSGFQAGYAALSLIGITQGIKGPYALLKAQDALYPQYPSPEEKARGFADDWRDWLREEATKLLAEKAESTYEYVDEATGETESMPAVAPRVVEHWRTLAA
jgi:hypothetical protein